MNYKNYDVVLVRMGVGGLPVLEQLSTEQEVTIGERLAEYPEPVDPRGMYVLLPPQLSINPKSTYALSEPVGNAKCIVVLHNSKATITYEHNPVGILRREDNKVIVEPVRKMLVLRRDKNQRLLFSALPPDAEILRQFYPKLSAMMRKRKPENEVFVLVEEGIHVRERTGECLRVTLVDIPRYKVYEFGNGSTCNIDVLEDWKATAHFHKGRMHILEPGVLKELSTMLDQLPVN